MTHKPIWIVLCLLALMALACSFTARQNSGLASDVSSGERMFDNFRCAGCHEDSNQGPSLVGIYNTEIILENGETVKADDAYLRESILDPKAKIVKGYQPIMPSFDAQLDEDEVDILIEYIRSLN